MAVSYWEEVSAGLGEYCVLQDELEGMAGLKEVCQIDKQRKWCSTWFCL